MSVLNGISKYNIQDIRSTFPFQTIDVKTVSAA